MFFGTTFLGLGIALFVIIAFVAFAILLFEVAMFVNVLRNKAITDNVKILWAIGMLLIHPFVAIAYYFTDRTKQI